MTKKNLLIVYLKASGTSVALFSPIQLNNLSPSNALIVAQQLGTGNQVSMQQAQSLARNLPQNANLSQVVGIVAALPPNRFTSMPPMDIANNIGNMNLNLMSNFQLAAIGTNV